MILIGGIMMITQEDIKRVLALFDDEDIPYILSDWVVGMMIPKKEESNKSKYVKIKTKGEKNDGSRK